MVLRLENSGPIARARVLTPVLSTSTKQRGGRVSLEPHDGNSERLERFAVRDVSPFAVCWHGYARACRGDLVFRLGDMGTTIVQPLESGLAPWETRPGVSQPAGAALWVRISGAGGTRPTEPLA